MLKRALSAEALKSLVTVIEPPLDPKTTAVCQYIISTFLACYCKGVRIMIIIGTSVAPGYGKDRERVQYTPKTLE